MHPKPALTSSADILWQKVQGVEGRRRHRRPREHRVGLPAMMSLMVEEMSKRPDEGRRLRLAGDVPVGEHALQRAVAVTAHKRQNPLILLDPSRSQRIEIVEENPVES